jgi:hypothetical protein
LPSANDDYAELRIRHFQKSGLSADDRQGAMPESAKRAKTGLKMAAGGCVEKCGLVSGRNSA